MKEQIQEMLDNLLNIDDLKENDKVSESDDEYGDIDIDCFNTSLSPIQQNSNPVTNENLFNENIEKNLLEQNTFTNRKESCGNIFPIQNEGFIKTNNDMFQKRKKYASDSKLNNKYINNKTENYNFYLPQGNDFSRRNQISQIQNPTGVPRGDISNFSNYQSNINSFKVNNMSINNNQINILQNNYNNGQFFYTPSINQNNNINLNYINIFNNTNNSSNYNNANFNINSNFNNNFNYNFNINNSNTFGASTFMSDMTTLNNSQSFQNQNIPVRITTKSENNLSVYHPNSINQNEISQIQKMHSNNNIVNYNFLNNMVTPANQNTQKNMPKNEEPTIADLANLLEKSDKIDHYIFNKIRGKFVSIIKQHKGSKLFQNYLKNTQIEILHLILVEISSDLNEIMFDLYANYFCKKLFKFLNQKDKIEFLNLIKDSIFKLSISNIGTYPLQGIIEEVGSKFEKNIIINSIKEKINEICFDTYGAHVIEKVISCFEEEFVSFIYDYAVENFVQMSCNSNSVCIIKKLVTFTYKKDLHSKIKNIIVENGINLMQHSVGNYVIQVIIENWEDLDEVYMLLKNNFAFLSMQKYSSNLVEKLIEKNKILLGMFIHEIVDNNQICEIIRNNYGNYVIQKAIKISEGADKDILNNCIYKTINKINNKKLISKWTTILSYTKNNDYNSTKGFFNNSNYNSSSNNSNHNSSDKSNHNSNNSYNSEL